MDRDTILADAGLDPAAFHKGSLSVRSPVDGSLVVRLATDSLDDVDHKIGRAVAAFQIWRDVPAPRRGELVRLFAEELRGAKMALGRLVTLESGKIVEEGRGEVQEMIDVADFAVGLSRQLYGLTIASERVHHHMRETWHPLGPVGVISAFNFPVAVWAWNAMLAFVCGDPVVWKPSEKTPLTALACQALFRRAAARFGDAPENLLQIVTGGGDVGEAMARDPRLPLISATGSTRMGRAVAPLVAARLGRSLLELGGNNAMIVAPSADLDLAQRAILFSAVGTAGQRCTTLRRLIAQRGICGDLVDRLRQSYGQIRIGDPFDSDTLMGPLIGGDAYEAMQNALSAARSEGGIVHGGERMETHMGSNAWYVRPAIVTMPEQTAIVRTETFAPILYVMAYDRIDDALTIHNDVPQGLASSIFTRDVREAERFVSATGSDCGIANVNIGPSGAEIGGAFGGEKETGGGRESGSDSWRAYMRRMTTTVNYSDALPLAQGIRFGQEPGA
ncbi:MAG: aldehyde dehydrogenase family protein [Alphaproteobacteria bacterium]